jgi:hypothetical protein
MTTTLDPYRTARLCRLYTDLGADIKELEQSRAEIRAELMATVQAQAVERIVAEGWAIRVSIQTRKTLNRLKLLEAGVDPTIIDGATDVTTSPMLTVASAKATAAAAE